METELEDKISFIFFYAALCCLLVMILTWNNFLISILLGVAGFVLAIGGIIFDKVKE